MDSIAAGLFMIKIAEWSKGNKAYDRWTGMTPAQKDKDAAGVKKEMLKKCFFSTSGKEICR